MVIGIDKFQFIGENANAKGWRKTTASLQNLSRSKQRKGIFWNRGKIAMKQQSKGSKFGQTCGHPKIVIFVQKV